MEVEEQKPLYYAKDVKIEANGASLEAKLGYSTNPKNRNVGIVITHPYSLLGGNMENNVVCGVFYYFRRLGFTVLRFNFRGVGNSKGSGSWRGTAERKDVLAACNFLLNYSFETDKDESNENNRVNKVLLVGYSYGSGIASSVVNELDSIIGYVAISYPFGPFFFLYFGNNALQQQADSKKPKLFIMGANDDFTSLDTLQSKFNGFSEPKEMIVVDKVDHFWFGREEGLCLRIFEWLKSTFPFIAQNFPLPST